MGKVDGRTITLGARALFINHRMPVPAREEESQYASGNQQVIYIGVDEAVCAMLVLTYAADRRRKNELQRLEDSGVSVIVRTTDPNVTPSWSPACSASTPPLWVFWTAAWAANIKSW